MGDEVEVPAELWMLWLYGCDDGDFKPGWVVTDDDAPRGPTYMVALSEEHAKAAATYQEELYGILCRPVRVK
jgi:hypothetical protein